MVRTLLRKVTLATLLAGSVFSQQQPAPSPDQPGVQQQEKVYKVNAGRVYEYHVKEQADLATKLVLAAADIQERRGNLPYVWGGDGFESLEIQKKSYGKCVTDKQPAGSWRVNQLTVPGVDCTGLKFQLLWNELGLKHYSRIAVKDYVDIEEKEGMLLKVETPEEIKEKAYPGYDVFLNEKGKWTHIATYLGNGFVLESVGTRADISTISPKDMAEWEFYAHPERHKKTKKDYGGIQVSSVDSLFERGEDVYLGSLPEFIPQELKPADEKDPKKKKKDAKKKK